MLESSTAGFSRRLAGSWVLRTAYAGLAAVGRIFILRSSIPWILSGRRGLWTLDSGLWCEEVLQVLQLGASYSIAPTTGGRECELIPHSDRPDPHSDRPDQCLRCCSTGSPETHDCSFQMSPVRPRYGASRRPPDVSSTQHALGGYFGHRLTPTCTIRCVLRRTTCCNYSVVPSPGLQSPRPPGEKSSGPSILARPAFIGAAVPESASLTQRAGKLHLLPSVCQFLRSEGSLSQPRAVNRPG